MPARKFFEPFLRLRFRDHYDTFMSITLSYRKAAEPANLFYAGFACIMLAFVVTIPPVWNTFIIPWRAETATSLLLIGVIFFCAAKGWLRGTGATFARDEVYGIILPMAMFIVWSALSMIWAASWKSAAHHTLVWAEYLIFYIAVRNVLREKGSYPKLINVLALTLAFLGILAVTAYVTFLIFGTGPRLGIVYAKFGEQVNTIFPLILVGALRLRGSRFSLSVLVLCVLWLLVFCSLSRTNLALFAFAFVAAAVFVFSLRRFYVYRARLAVIAVCLTLAPLPLHIVNLIAIDPGIPMARRVGDSTGISGSNDFRKLMISLAAEMIADKPLTGVGADNFGIETNKYREIYAAENAGDRNLAQAESEIPERAHNEYFQIVAELGVVGGAIFLWFLIGITIFLIRGARHLGNRLTLFHIAAVQGLVAFLASSLVTSYSFRLVQNGIVFFVVLAIAVRLFENNALEQKPLRLSSRERSWALAGGAAACLAMLLLTGARVASTAYTSSANYTADAVSARQKYNTAILLDDENAEAPYFFAMRLIQEKDYKSAISMLEKSIILGRATSADFSYLASAQALSGDTAAAEATMARALRLYPRSPFVLVRYAELLKANGKSAESAARFSEATEIDNAQAQTWRTYISSGPLAASQSAFRNKTLAEVMDLRPQIAFEAVKMEREIRFPEEKFKF